MAVVVANFSLHWPSDFVFLLGRAFLQGLLSTLAALVLGAIGAVGLLALSRRFETVVLLPIAVPSMALILVFFHWFPQWRGLTAVVAAHALQAAGLVAVALSHLVRERHGAALELALVEGCDRRRLWMCAVLPQLRNEWVSMALTLLLVFLSSFSIPLLLGGANAATFEIAIHRAIRLEGNWGVAAALSLGQWGLLFIIVLLAHRFRSDEPPLVVHRTWSASIASRVGWAPAAVVVLFAPIAMAIVLLSGAARGAAQIRTAGLWVGTDGTALWIWLVQGTLATAVLGALLCVGLLLAFSLIEPSARTRLWVSSYVAPSVAITGFATLAVGWGSMPSMTLDCVRVAIGSALLFAPTIWRLRWNARLQALDGQVAIAKSLGGTRWMVARRVLLPQLAEVGWWSAALTGFWLWGDFSIGAVAASRPYTLAMTAKGLAESYRTDAAALVTVVALLGGALMYWLLARENHVAR